MRCRRASGRGGNRFCARQAVRRRVQNWGAPAILDGRQSPRRHAMAMLISLSHREEREITVLPPNPRNGRSGLTAKHSPAAVLPCFRTGALPRCALRTREGSGSALASADDGAGHLQGSGPLAGASLSAREIRACRGSRDGDGAGGKCAGGPKQEASHPQERACARDRVRHS